VNNPIRLIAKNFTLLSLLKVILTFMPFIYLPHIINTLGIGFYGKVILALSLASYFLSFTDFGFNLSATRDIAIHKNSKNQVNLIINKVLIVKTFLLLTAVLVYILIITTLPPFSSNKTIYFLILLTLIGNSYFPNWFFLGIENVTIPFVINLVTKSLFTLSIFIFIRTEDDKVFFPLLIAISSLLSGVLGMLGMYYYAKFSFKIPKQKRIREYARGSLHLFYNQLLPNLYNNSSTFILGLIATPEITGGYGAMRKIFSLFEGHLLILSKVFYPSNIRMKESFHNYRKVILIMTVIGLILLYLMSSYILNIFSIHIEYRHGIFNILLLSSFEFILYNIFGVNYYIANRKDFIVLKSVILGSIIGFTLMLPMIYFYSALGASISILVARSITSSNLIFKYYYFNENRHTS